MEKIITENFYIMCKPTLIAVNYYVISIDLHK